RSDNNVVGVLLGDGPGLAVCIDLRGFDGIQMLRRDFRRATRKDAKVHPQLPEQLRPARRIGGKNERRQDHEMEWRLGPVFTTARGSTRYKTARVCDRTPPDPAPAGRPPARRSFPVRPTTCTR